MDAASFGEGVSVRRIDTDLVSHDLGKSIPEIQDRISQAMAKYFSEMAKEARQNCEDVEEKKREKLRRRLRLLERNLDYDLKRFGLA